LKVTKGPEAGRKLLTPPEGATIGRSPQADIVIRDTRLSRQHVCIYQRRGKDWIIEDLGSRNGMLVNGEPVEKGALYPGDRVEIGSVTLRVGEGFPLKPALAAALGVVLIGILALVVHAHTTPAAGAGALVPASAGAKSSEPNWYNQRKAAIDRESQK